jgi:hypothetical protein
MHSENFTKGKRPRILQGEIFTDKDIPPFMTMTEWNKKHNLGDKKWIQEFVEKRSNQIMEQAMTPWRGSAEHPENKKGVANPSHAMTPWGGFQEPDWSTTPYANEENPAEAFRNDYLTNVDSEYDFGKLPYWGELHDKAFNDLMAQKSADKILHNFGPSPVVPPPIDQSIQDFGPTGTGHGSILQPFDPIIPGPAPDEYITTSKDRPVAPTVPQLNLAYPESTGGQFGQGQEYVMGPTEKDRDYGPLKGLDPNATPNRPEYDGTGALMSWLGGNFADEYMPNLVQGQKDWDDQYGPIITKTKVKHPAPELINDPNTFFAATDAEASSKNENRRIAEIKRHTKQRINEMVEDELKDNKLGNGRMISGEPKDIKYKAGMEVKDINPDCPHRNSRGVVIKVTNGDVTYKVTNFGRHFSIGDELTKSTDQLIPLSSKDKPWYLAGE